MTRETPAAQPLLRWVDNGKNDLALFLGDLETPVAELWLSNNKKWFQAIIELPGAEPTKQYGPLEGQKQDVEAQVSAWLRVTVGGVWPADRGASSTRPRPIAMAPQDGTKIDAWLDGKRYPDVYWGSRCGVFGWCGMDPDLTPTHWTPVPKAPRGKRKTGT